MTKILRPREIRTKVRGVTRCNEDGESRQDIILGLSAGDPLDLEREPLNEADENAIAVYSQGLQIGYLSRELAEELAPLMDAGGRFSAEVLDVTGDETYGVNVVVRYLPPGAVNVRYFLDFDPQSTIAPLLPMEIAIFGYDLVIFIDNGEMRAMVSGDRGPDPYSTYYSGGILDAGPELVQRFVQYFLTTRAAGHLLRDKRLGEISALCALWLIVEMTPRGSDGKLKTAVQCLGLNEDGSRCTKNTKHAFGLCSKHQSADALTVWVVPIKLNTDGAEHKT